MQKSFFFSFFILFSSFAIAQDQYDVIHYKYELTLSDKSANIEGKAVIRIKALQSLKSFDLDLSKEKNGKGMKVQRIQQGEKDANRLAYVFTNDKLTTIFKDTLQKGREREITVFYSGVPADGLIIDKNKYGDRTFFADNWPNRAHFWIPCKDRPDDKASFEFIVNAPAQYRVISNGVLEEEKLVNKLQKRTHWKTNIALPTKVMVIGVAKFAVREYADSPKGIPVSAWVYQQDSANGYNDYSKAPAILRFFIDYIAPYPFEKLANVQSKTIFGGMENASAIFYNETSVTGKGNVEDLLAHEIAHQWFGDMASEKNFSHLWLSEGFATYLTNVYLQQAQGDDIFRKRLEDERKQVIDFVKTNDRPVVDSLSPYMDLLNANSYQKAGWVLHMLRGEVGDKTFQKIIQNYYRQYKGGNANTRDFEVVAEKVSGKELTWFFDQWLYRPGIPEMDIETKLQDNEFFLYVKQKGQPYRFNLEVMVVAEDGEVIKEKFLVEHANSEFKIPVKGMRISFTLDPDVKLLYKF